MRAFLWAFIRVGLRQLVMGRTHHLPGFSPDEQPPQRAHLGRLKRFGARPIWWEASERQEPAHDSGTYPSAPQLCHLRIDLTAARPERILIKPCAVARRGVTAVDAAPTPLTISV
jgi:hypothetical protein